MEQVVQTLTTSLPFPYSGSQDVNATQLTSESEIHGSFINFQRDIYCKIVLIYLNHVITFSVFALVGLIGNITLLFVILRTPGLRNSPNILLINITIADLLYMLIATPFSIIHELYPCWFYGAIACKFKHFLPLVAQAACILSLAALSRERYNAIVRGLETRIIQSTKRTMIVVVLTWVVGIIIAAPIFWLSKTYAGGLLCQYLPMKLSSQIYILIQFTMLYVLPLLFIAGNYILLARSLCSSPRINLVQNQSAVNSLQARKRLAQIVLAITFLFGVLWLPYYVYFLWFVFNNNSVARGGVGNFISIRLFRHFYYYMSLANSCLNPWVVFVMSSAHRRAFVQCFSRSKCNIKHARCTANRRTESSCRVSTTSNSCPTSMSKL